MLHEVIESYLCDLLAKRFKQYPLGEVIKKAELLDSLPDFEKQPNGAYVINRMNTVFDGDDLDSIIVDALNRIEDEGYFVDGLYSEEYGLFERLTSGDKLELDTLKEMEYREEIELTPFSPEGFILKGRTLSGIEKHFSNVEAAKVDLSDEQLNRLRQIINRAGLANWEEEYRPPGGVIVMDGSSWSFKMIFEGNKAFVSRGDNAWPEGFEKFYKSIMSLLEEGATS